jgi:hypothetical protein
MRCGKYIAASAVASIKVSHLTKEAFALPITNAQFFPKKFLRYL